MSVQKHTPASVIPVYLRCWALCRRITAHKHFSEHFNYCPVVLWHLFSAVFPVWQKMKKKNFKFMLNAYIFTILQPFSGLSIVSHFYLLAFIYEMQVWQVQWIYKTIRWCNRWVITFTNIINVSRRHYLSVYLSRVKSLLNMT